MVRQHYVKHPRNTEVVAALVAKIPGRLAEKAMAGAVETATGGWETGEATVPARREKGWSSALEASANTEEFGMEGMVVAAVVDPASEGLATTPATYTITACGKGKK